MHLLRVKNVSGPGKSDFTFPRSQSDKSYLSLPREKKRCETFDVCPFPSNRQRRKELAEMKTVSCGTCRSVTSRNLPEATKLTALSHSYFGRSKYVERSNAQSKGLTGQTDRWLLRNQTLEPGSSPSAGGQAHFVPLTELGRMIGTGGGVEFLIGISAPDGWQLDTRRFIV